ncbi:hypothetical protein GCM10023206_20710 [Acinetobacter puyangensis]|uniref:diguanylate cyclase n=1 Tax=Acinetobacter puyangensis TaxID=1096779 RepID=A0A240ECX1_9GAMM|nr:diguanylate cyclase [Acinetobacter puyangensis]SNX46542.1 diguanylate cyclase (GGDEF) domain-containing protein [Acinetobacter puyangensis]
MENTDIDKNIVALKSYYDENPSAILENPHIGVCLFFPNGRIIYANEKIASIYQITLQRMYEKRIHDFCHYTAHHYTEFLTQLELEQHVKTQEMYANGAYYLYKIQGKYKNQQLILIVTLVDITPYKRIELVLEKNNRQLQQIRLLDRMTGLNNYTAFERKIQDIYQDKSQESISMILLNIDNFKRFNLENGFESGDAAIKKMSACLDRFSDSVEQLLFHLGRDEFIFILLNMQDWNLYTFVERLKVEIHNINIYFSSGIDNRLTVSLAIEKYQSGAHFDIDFFLVRLQNLMQQAKQQGGNCWIDRYIDLQYKKTDD